jgi:hypothetical protein
MEENIKVRWLTDHEQNKIAPKTLVSQVLNEDGTLFKEQIEKSLQDLSSQIEKMPSPVQIDWNQNDESALDFIKNKPFGTTGEYKEIILVDNSKPWMTLTTGLYLYSISENFDPNYQYKVILNEQEYLCTPQLDSLGSYCLGNVNGSANLLEDFLDMDLSTLEWGEGEPFCICSNLLTVKPPYESSYILSIIKLEEEIYPLDRKFINYIPGEKTTHKVVTYENEEKTCEQGAEIFNDYANNIAIGSFSTAQGMETIAVGSYSHAEGSETKAIVYGSHAEGYKTETNKPFSHAEGARTKTNGLSSHAEGSSTETRGENSHTEGEGTIATGANSHVQGRYNIADEFIPNYSQIHGYYTSVPEYDGEKQVYVLLDVPVFNEQDGTYTIGEVQEYLYKEMQPGMHFLFSLPTSNTVSTYYRIEKLLSSRTDEATNKTYYKWQYSSDSSAQNTSGANPKYAYIVGNGISEDNRSNAHTLTFEGDAWFAKDVYVGSTSGIDRDEGSKKLATEDYVKSLYEKLESNTRLGFYCIEDVTIIVNGVSKIYPANSTVEVSFTKDDVFEIVPTSDNSILTLTAFPGALGTYYSWLEGVKQFSNILFDMNTEDMYVKWSQGNQGAYQVQFAQYTNCIFWSDNAYVNDTAKRTNYTLCSSSQLPLCYSNIPDNTFKAFYLAFGVNSDPNWSNPAYKESFAKATWATQVFSYYGARIVGYPGHDSSNFIITLPKDCRGLMFDARNIECAGTFDAANVANFGAKQGSWREAFGDCPSLRRLYIKNLKINLNISWSPVDYASIYYIISKAANTNKITIYVSPYTWNLLSQSDFDLATSKNITIALITTNYVEDKRLSDIANKADKGYVDEKVAALVNSAPEALDTIGELAAAFQENDEIVNALNEAIGTKADKTYVNELIANIPVESNVVIVDCPNGTTISHTFEQIMTAINNNKMVYALIYGTILAHLTYIADDDSFIEFHSVNSENTQIDGLKINNDNTFSIKLVKLATEEYIDIRVPAWTSENEGAVLKIVNGTPTWVNE